MTSRKSITYESLPDLWGFEKRSSSSGVCGIMTRLILSLFLLGLFSSGYSQQKGKSKSTGPLPLQGEMLPDLAAIDANGEPFPLRQQLKGRHGVIVFGCLT